MIDREELNRKRAAIEGENGKFYRRLKKRFPAGIDDEVMALDEEVFSNIDCLKCANCCKTTPALVDNEDVNRISKHLRISPKEFVTKHVTKDADGDTVLNRTPCTFLGADNKCTIYEVRPFACKDYPHTNRKKMQQLLPLTVHNARICPAVSRILDNISEALAE